MPNGEPGPADNYDEQDKLAWALNYPCPMSGRDLPAGDADGSDSGDCVGLHPGTSVGQVSGGSRGVRDSPP